MNYQQTRDCETRLKVVKGKLNQLQVKSLLDFGGAEGYFAQNLKGHNPVLVDDIRDVNISGVEFIKKRMNANDIKELLKRDFDCVLLLSILHHFDNYGEVFNLFLNNSKHLFVEILANNEGKQIKNSHISKYLKNLVKNQNYELLTKTKAHLSDHLRPLYYVTKKEMSYIKGEVKDGTKNSTGHMTKNSEKIHECLGDKMFPGSLNVYVGDLKLINPIQLKVPEYKLSYDFYPCNFQGLDSFIMRPPGTKDGELAEIVAEVKLRDVFGLEDGDEVFFSVQEEYLG